MRDDAGVYHDDNELQALHDRRRSRIGQADGEQVGKRISEHAERGEHRHDSEIARALEQLDESGAVEQQDHRHEHRAGEQLADAQQPDGVDLVMGEQVARRRSREAPENTAQKCGHHADDQATRLAIVQAFANRSATSARSGVGIGARFDGRSEAHALTLVLARFQLLLCHAHPPSNLIP